jgi:hypothetical protein
MYIIYITYMFFIFILIRIWWKTKEICGIQTSGDQTLESLAQDHRVTQPTHGRSSATPQLFTGSSQLNHLSWVMWRFLNPLESFDACACHSVCVCASLSLSITFSESAVTDCRRANGPARNSVSASELCSKPRRHVHTCVYVRLFIMCIYIFFIYGLIYT